jgi:hypothetical protein
MPKRVRHSLPVAGTRKPQYKAPQSSRALPTGEEPDYRLVRKRHHGRPSARAGTLLRLYDRRAVAMVRHEPNAIDARRCRKAVDCGE